MSNIFQHVKQARICVPAAGLASAAPLPYLGAMQFFARLSPVRAYKDLRFFLAQRHPYELGFLAAALAVTGFFLYAFMRSDYVPPVYQPHIIYVQQWRADRTDAQIKAQQAIDKVDQDKRIADQKAAEAKVKADYRKLDQSLSKWGL